MIGQWRARDHDAVLRDWIMLHLSPVIAMTDSTFGSSAMCFFDAARAVTVFTRGRIHHKLACRPEQKINQLLTAQS